MHSTTRWFCIILLFLLYLAFISNACADECQKLQQIPAWEEGMTALNIQMTQKNWDEALKTTEKLYNICERSPILNYEVPPKSWTNKFL